MAAKTRSKVMSYGAAAGLALSIMRTDAGAASNTVGQAALPVSLRTTTEARQAWTAFVNWKPGDYYWPIVGQTPKDAKYFKTFEEFDKEDKRLLKEHFAHKPDFKERVGNVISNRMIKDVAGAVVVYMFGRYGWRYFRNRGAEKRALLAEIEKLNKAQTGK